MHTYVCVGLVYVHIYTHAKVKGYCQLSYSLTIHLRFLRQGLSLYLQPLVLTRIIGQDLSVSIPSTRFIDIKSNNQILCRHWGFELSSSCFQCKSSYYLSHTLSTFFGPCAIIHLQNLQENLQGSGLGAVNGKNKTNKNHYLNGHRFKFEEWERWDGQKWQGKQNTTFSTRQPALNPEKEHELSSKARNTKWQTRKHVSVKWDHGRKMPLCWGWKCRNGNPSPGWSHWTTVLLGITGNYMKSSINQLGNLVQQEMEVKSYWGWPLRGAPNSSIFLGLHCHLDIANKDE